jgi:hypothetical protein
MRGVAGFFRVLVRNTDLSMLWMLVFRMHSRLESDCCQSVNDAAAIIAGARPAGFMTAARSLF